MVDRDVEVAGRKRQAGAKMLPVLERMQEIVSGVVEHWSQQVLWSVQRAASVLINRCALATARCVAVASWQGPLPMAEMITDLSVHLPNVQEASHLVIGRCLPTLSLGLSNLKALFKFLHAEDVKYWHVIAATHTPYSDLMLCLP
jgi:hypothetical protein